jgi:hypothetical protein
MVEAAMKTKGFRQAGKMLEHIAKIYQYSDDWMKVVAYESELRTLAKAFPEQVGADGTASIGLRQDAADRVRATLPTYSKVPRVMKMLNRNPLFGTFVSFASEVYRNMYNTFKMSWDDMNSGNRVLAESGIKRIASQLLTMSITPAVAHTMRSLLGIDWEEEKLKRLFRPPWQKNAAAIPMWRNDDGTVTEIDFSYTDPYSIFHKPIRAAIVGKNFQEKALGATWEVTSTFIGEEIFTGALIDALVNQKDMLDGFMKGVSYPRRIYARELGVLGAKGFVEKVGRGTWYVLGETEPGTVTSAKRIYYGVKGIKIGSRLYDPMIETAATFTGFRPYTENLNKALYYKGLQFKDAYSSVKQDFHRDLVVEVASPTELSRPTIKKGNEMLERLFDKFYEEYHAAIKVQGLSAIDLYGPDGSMTNAGISKHLMDQVKMGVWFGGMNKDGFFYGGNDKHGNKVPPPPPSQWKRMR